MKVLVTGATGFIGGHLVPRLVAAGHEVTAVVRRRDGGEPAGANVVQVDLARDFASDGLPSAEAVVHLAQANVQFPDAARELYGVNTVATLALLDHARRSGARVFIYASSGSVYGAGDGRRSEDDPLGGEDFYALTKRHGEQLVAAYGSVLMPIVLRLFAPYGPGQRGRLIPSLIERVRTGTPVTLNDGGRPRLTPIFVSDVVDVIDAAIRSERPLVANVAGDAVASIRDLAEAIGTTLGRSPIFEEGRQQVGGDVLGDNRRMRRELGIVDLVDLEQGLARTAKSAAT